MGIGRIIVVGLLALYVCHRLVGHARNGSTKNLIISLEWVAVLILLVAFSLGEVLRIAAVVNGPAGNPVPGLSWEDFAIVLTTVFASVTLLLTALWCLKKLGYKN